MKSATVSRVVYLLETKFRATQRTVARLQPLVARQRKAKRGVKELATANHVVYLLEAIASSNVVSSRTTPAPRS
ncbi:hypothetical protein [Pilibacter termitis]|uniref:hypothetical protein n=1 Tax=Pilibacter termitis TaxID=263852 RepID=UPI00099B12C2|nr:hypothetical protein [Pilibacter termitis]